MSAIVNYLKRAFGFSESKRALLLGLDSSGRTTFLYKLVLPGQVITTIPTIGFNVETVKIHDFTFTVWDVGGCDKIRPLWRHYYHDTSIVFVFVDCADHARLDEADFSLTLIKEADELQHIPILVVANKQDLPNAISPEKLIEKLKLREALKGRDWACLPCSAYKGEGIQECMEWAYQAGPRPKLDLQTPEEKQAQLLNSWLEQEDEPDDVFLMKLTNYELDSWDHRTHLRIAWLYLTKYGRKEGMKHIFNGIKNFIMHSGKAKKTAFHETLTYFWVHMIHYAIATTQNPTNDFKGFLAMNPQYSNALMWNEYYSRDLMMGKSEARSQVVLPDLKPLPSLVSDVSKGSVVDINKVAQIKSYAESDDDLITKFESRSLTGWNHKIFLHIVYSYIKKLGRKAGLERLINNLRDVLKAGFHFTITYFWGHMIDYAIAKSPEATFDEIIKSNEQLLDDRLYLEYYSMDSIESEQAARDFALPSKPLPSVVTK